RYVLAGWSASPASCCGPPAAFRSFPTRRSSDLVGADDARGLGGVEREDGAVGEGTVTGRHERAVVQFLAQQLDVDAAVVAGHEEDRKSTRLNSSHQITSYAVFCLIQRNSSPGHT